MERIKTLKGALLAGAFVAASASAALAEFPERNIEIIHPWGPGNAMAMSQVVAKYWKRDHHIKVPTFISFQSEKSVYM